MPDELTRGRCHQRRAEASLNSSIGESLSRSYVATESTALSDQRSCTSRDFPIRERFDEHEYALAITGASFPKRVGGFENTLAAIVQYGLLAGQDSNSIVIRWNETDLELCDVQALGDGEGRRIRAGQNQLGIIA